MRTDIPGTEHWIEHRGPEELKVGDVDAYNAPIEEVSVARANAADSEDGDGMEVSADGLTMTPKPRTPAPGTELTVDHIRRRRDDLLSSVITGWSFEGFPLPYSAASRAQLPAVAIAGLTKVYDTLSDAIQGIGSPKETTSPTSETEPPTAPSDGSATTSGDTSPSPLPDSATEPSETAAG
jgi:hypothetical protein